MKTNTVLRNIRFESKNALTVIRKGLINKSELAGGKQFIEVSSVSLPIAQKFNNLTAIDVKVNNNWCPTNGSNTKLAEYFTKAGDEFIEDIKITQVKEETVSELKPEEAPSVEEVVKATEEIAEQPVEEIVSQEEVAEDATKFISEGDTPEEVVEESESEEEEDETTEEESEVEEENTISEEAQPGTYSFRKKKKRH